ncbi:MAG TPA: TonB-dependent receptor, partial [Thermoanaerobaculia bacterium]|nr:TonB-dependent receptor [Thermoanaerobaculia bacterium]
LSRLLPHVPNATAVGAMALFSGARLQRRGLAALAPLAAMALSDFLIDFGTGRRAVTPVRAAIYGSLIAGVFIGRLLRGRASAGRIAAAGLAGSTAFSLVTNFAVWASTGMYPANAAGLLACYAAAVPLFRTEALATLAWSAVLFGLEELSRRTPAVRLRAVLPTLLVAAGVPGILRGQTPAPVSENVVVSASLAPEIEPAVSSSVTVITRKQIERSGKTDVLELLREVPGVDVVQAGDAGKVTSVFLRGTNSTQTLVLIDGVRVNSPYFAGYDFSALSTQDVERIEIVRGPFSALYGSDAIGGVISILRRKPSAEPAGRATVAAGDRSFHEETLFASASAGPFGFSISGRDAHDGGQPQEVAGARVDNDAWRDRNGAAEVEWNVSPVLTAGLRAERMFARSEIPSDSGQPTPHRFTDFAQTTWTLPVRAKISEENALAGSLYDVELHPTAVDPDDASGFFQSETRARTRGGRVVDSWKLSEANTLSGVASYERSTVDSSGAFGTLIAGRRISTWGAGVDDQLALLGDRLHVVAGVRFDRHSAFGSSTNPRLSLVWNVAASDAIRASWGTAFRAPSIGELYYPFFGNPDLDPERSRSVELGFTHIAGRARLDVALFRNDIRDLIQYDPVRQTNGNVGRARTEGVEAEAS